MIITTPGDYVAAMVAMGPAGTDFSAPSPPGLATRLVYLQPGATSTEFNVVRIDRLSSSELVSSGLWSANNDAGFVAYRHTYASLTAYMTASEMFNSGTVTSAQFDGAGVDGLGLFSPSALQYPCTLTKRFRVPLDEESLLESVVGARVAPAKEGVYVPLRMFGGSFPYADMARADGRQFLQVPASPWPPTTLTGVTYLGLPSPPSTTRDMGVSYVPIATGGGASSGDVAAGLGAVRQRLTVLDGQSTLRFGDLGYTDTNCSVTIFRGLSYEASITIKVLSGIEAVADARAAIRSMAQPGAKPCPAAIEAYFELSKSLPPVLPARDNSAGLLLGKILSLLPIVLPRVKRAVEALVAPPPEAVPPARPAAAATPPERPLKKKRRAGKGKASKK